MTDSDIFKPLLFKQSENSCQIAALGAVHYYFSKIQHKNPNYLQDTIHFGNLFKSYLNYIESSSDLSPEERHKYFLATPDYCDLTDNIELEKRVHETYLGFCIARELRGSEHIARFSDYLSCQENAPKIKAIAYQGKDVKLEDIINELQKRNSLIAVLIDRENHWIVLGCDNQGVLFAIDTSLGCQLVQRKTKSEIEHCGITEYIKYSPSI